MEIDYYQTSRGDCPVYEFIQLQGIKVRNKITRAIDFLHDEGLIYSIKKNESEKIKPYKNIYTLRIAYNGCWYRIFYTIKNNIACLLFGVKKHQDKLERKDTDKADRISKEIGFTK